MVCWDRSASYFTYYLTVSSDNCKNSAATVFVQLEKHFYLKKIVIIIPQN